MEKIFLTEDEKKQLISLQTKETEILNKIGEIEVNLKVLTSQKETKIQEATKLNEQKTTIAQQLQDKYGEGSINLETGEFTKVN
jgi:hypothetical protein